MYGGNVSASSETVPECTEGGTSIIGCIGVMVMDGAIVVLLVGILLWMLLVYGWRGTPDDDRYEWTDDDPDGEMVDGP